MNIVNFTVLMRRTLENLDYIKQRDESEPHAAGTSPKHVDKVPYAVTQRINSCLGALVHVYDHTLAKERVGKTDVFQPARHVPANWPSFGKHDQHPAYPPPGNAGEYCMRLRHALAHGQVDFEAANDEITRVHFYTRKNMGQGAVNWAGSLSVTELGEFLYAFEQFILATYDDQGAPKAANPLGAAAANP